MLGLTNLKFLRQISPIVSFFETSRLNLLIIKLNRFSVLISRNLTRFCELSSFVENRKVECMRNAFLNQTGGY